METDERLVFSKVKSFFSRWPLIFDIGANYGEYTDMVLEELSGKNFNVCCFEPNKKLFEILIEKYKYDMGVAIFPSIISDTDEDKLFYYFTNENHGLSSIYKRPVFSDLPMQTETLPATTLDLFSQKQNYYYFIDFIKIDVEGAEFNVLNGAEKLLNDKRIKFIQIEYGYTYADAGIKLSDVIAYLEKLGYNLYSFKDNEFIKVQNFQEDYHFENYLITYLQL